MSLEMIHLVRSIGLISFISLYVFPHLTRLLQLGITLNLFRVVHAATEKVTRELAFLIAFNPAY